jgi:hypothetical protein
MGHVIFIVLHLISVLFVFPMLLLTVPLHMIYAALSRKSGQSTPFIPGPGDIAAGYVHEVNCPYCRELIRSDALKCKHCGSLLTGIHPPT